MEHAGGLAVAALLLAGGAPAFGGHACLDVRTPNIVSLSGRLTSRTFPGPPNYHSAKRGDRPEGAFILLLRKPLCFDDGGHFAGRVQGVTSVHVFSGDDALSRTLRRRVGREAKVTGEAFAAETGHHHAPLVLEVKRVGR
jgi:hypothetical protein